ncbi:MAG: hypothetical protein ABI551_22170 [Polyangiaceae bacterium]
MTALRAVALTLGIAVGSLAVGTGCNRKTCVQSSGNKAWVQPSVQWTGIAPDIGTMCGSVTKAEDGTVDKSRITLDFPGPVDPIEDLTTFYQSKGFGRTAREVRGGLATATFAKGDDRIDLVLARTDGVWGADLVLSSIACISPALDGTACLSDTSAVVACDGTMVERVKGFCNLPMRCVFSRETAGCAAPEPTPEPTPVKPHKRR